MELKPSKLMFIPILLLVASVAILFMNYVGTGDFIIKDIDLRGGTLITIGSDEKIDTKLVEDKINERFGSGIVSGLRTVSGYGVSIQVDSGTKVSDVVEAAESAGVNVGDVSEQTIGPVLGSLFFEQVRNSLIMAFIMMSIVIFIIYRNPISSLGIVLASLGNILATLAFADLFGIELSFASFAGMLMLIAFTVDTNIVLTSKVVAYGNESFMAKYKRAFVTGATLTATITATMIIVLFLSSSKLLINIAEILVIGFVTDLVYTWILNAGMLEIYLGRKNRAHGGSNK
jgi:preprotein translocase subunit SecF